jgi:hypothetical protein
VDRTPPASSLLLRTPFQDVTERKNGKGKRTPLGSCEAMIASEVSLGYDKARGGRDENVPGRSERRGWIRNNGA